MTIKHFAYPCGRFDKAAIDAVADAGYRYAYTTCLHHDENYPLLTISRKFLWERSCVDARGAFSPAIMDCQVKWFFDLVKRCKQDHGTPPASAILRREITAVSVL